MTWQTGTTNDYLTALQDLIDIATSDHVATVAVNNGGSSYVVGDVLTVAGGTSTHTATLLVTSVSGGVINGVRVQNGGAYTSNPTLTANSVTGGTGSGATMNLTMSATGWSVDRREYRGGSAVPSAGGSGYTLNDILVTSGGTSTEAATWRVTQVSGGAVIAVEPVDPGATSTVVEATGRYSATPSNPASTTTSGGGSGCTLTISYEQELIMEGVGTGAQDITVGIKTYRTLDTTGFETCYNWALFAMGSYNSGLHFFEQPQISPGFSSSPAVDPGLQVTQGAFVPLRDQDGSFPITYWFNITPQRIICVFKVEGSVTTEYSSMHLGYLNQLGTTTEIPFPMYVSGCCHRKNVYYADTTPYITGLTSMDGGGLDNGPGFIYRPHTGEWAGVCNADVAETGTSRAFHRDSAVYPGGNPNQVSPASGFGQIAADGWSAWTGAFPDTGVPGTATWELYPTPDSGGDIYWILPATVADSDDGSNDFFAWGEMDDVFWVHRAGTLTSEDTITIGSDQYRVFQNGNRTAEWDYMAIKETF